ncbi:uncharacterized protein LOC143048962 [Mytilus galloprovincialis]|uniref:uncharacterized protein LOC143048962 n=1 Tax=Mytilus galloprovincialis TaxID=29158 RepID=UPI003F7B8DF6
MDNHNNEAIDDNDPPSTTSTVIEPSESETVAAGTSVMNQIVGDKDIEWWLELKSWDVLIGPNRKTDDENLGCIGFMNQKDVDPINLKDMHGSGDRNLPYPVKDTGQDRKTDDENLGCIGFTNQRRVDSVNREDMDGSGDKNWPNPVKDNGRDHKTDDKNRGCSGFTIESKVDPVNLQDMNGSGDSNWLNPVKDSGQDREAADKKIGCSSFTNHKNVNPVKIEDMDGSGDNNWPNPVKDTFEPSEHKSKVIPENDQSLGSSMNTTKDRQMQIDEHDEKEIYKAVKNGNTIPIPDDMGDLMTPPCNTNMHDGGSSCKVNNDEGKVKMSCGMESRNAY